MSAHGLPRQVVFRVDTAMFARWAHAKFVPLGDPLHTTGWIATVDDITDRRRTESELAHRATHDPLTKLPNRLLLEDRMRQACARLRRDTNSVSVLFIDMDGFKAINDKHGHAAGDKVLQAVAATVLRRVRTPDIPGRIGGEEFTVLLPETGAEEAVVFAERLRADLERLEVDYGGHTIRFSCSFGVASRGEDIAVLDTLLMRADEALYRAKNQGRNRVATDA